MFPGGGPMVFPMVFPVVILMVVQWWWRNTLHEAGLLVVHCPIARIFTAARNNATDFAAAQSAADAVIS